jgi:TM2 domain-containing membrane protein YozV
MKSKGLAYLLWFFLGAFSAHRFYLGKIGTGILYLLTGQLFGIGWIIDLFILSGMVDKYNLTHGFIGQNRNNVHQNVVVNVQK